MDAMLFVALQVVKSRNIAVNTRRNLVEVRHAQREAVFQDLDNPDKFETTKVSSAQLLTYIKCQNLIVPLYVYSNPVTNLFLRYEFTRLFVFMQLLISLAAWVYLYVSIRLVTNLLYSYGSNGANKRLVYRFQ